MGGAATATVRNATWPVGHMPGTRISNARGNVSIKGKRATRGITVRPGRAYLVKARLFGTKLRRAQPMRLLRWSTDARHASRRGGRTAASTTASSQVQILALQRSAGNAAVVRMLSREYESPPWAHETPLAGLPGEAPEGYEERRQTYTNDDRHALLARLNERIAENTNSLADLVEAERDAWSEILLDLTLTADAAVSIGDHAFNVVVEVIEAAAGRAGPLVAASTLLYQLIQDAVGAAAANAEVRARRATLERLLATPTQDDIAADGARGELARVVVDATAYASWLGASHDADLHLFRVPPRFPAIAPERVKAGILAAWLFHSVQAIPVVGTTCQAHSPRLRQCSSLGAQSRSSLSRSAVWILESLNDWRRCTHQLQANSVVIHTTTGRCSPATSCAKVCAPSPNSTMMFCGEGGSIVDSRMPPRSKWASTPTRSLSRLASPGFAMRPPAERCYHARSAGSRRSRPADGRSQSPLRLTPSSVMNAFTMSLRMRAEQASA